MKFQLSDQLPGAQISACLVLPVLHKGVLLAATQIVNANTNNLLQDTMQQHNFSAKLGTTLFIPANKQYKHSILLIGCGLHTKLNIGKFRKLVASSIMQLVKHKINAAQLLLTELSIPGTGQDHYLVVRHAVEAILAATYRFNAYQSKHKNIIFPQDITLCNTVAPGFTQQQLAIQHATATAHAKFLVKDLCNTPPNICTPEYMTNQAKEICHTLHMSYEMLPEAQLAAMGMGSFCSVAQGSKNRGNFTIVRYKGHHDPDAKPIILIGKGITFDSGGYSLKPRQNMVNMKFDMTGSAVCLATIKACAELKLPLNVIAILALAENMCSSTASRPDDIVTSLSGKTIEINNTDAEGRLILADAITYAQQYQPRVIIDVATLTGACVIALGTTMSGFFTNNDKLAAALHSAATKSGDSIWRLPIIAKYNKELRQGVADLKNTLSKPDAGSIVAACFLSNFIGKHPWVHLDIAGTAYEMQHNAMLATGRPTQLLIQYLLDAAQAE